MRTILHCDLNSFYASVEIFLNPELKGKAVAVCGNKENRHGIVLAKSDIAKKYGVITGEAIWEAKQKCPDLIIIPPQYNEYVSFSRRVRDIYEEYTDLVEPFGMDECWLDVTGSERLFGDGEKIANTIRERVKTEIGITISVGVSFNKVFAKLGSDLKKPDAITIIPYEKFKEIVFPLPATYMLGVGPNVGNKLKGYCIETIGDLANSDKDFIKNTLGKAGEYIWNSANGIDNSPVHRFDYKEPVKSIGRGTTCPRDLENDDEVYKIICTLSQSVSHQLRKNNFCANGIQITVKDSTLLVKQYQTPLSNPTQCFGDISKKVFGLFKENYKWNNRVRSITVRAINLTDENEPSQLDLFNDYNENVKRENAEEAIEKIRNKYGISAINIARCL